MSEDDSFEMMKYILFHRGLRKQYKPDMDALQVLYCYDNHKKDVLKKDKFTVGGSNC
jgi:hypothetical protein